MLLIALVIGGNTTVFATVRMVLGSPAAGVNMDRLVILAPVRQAFGEPFLSYPDFVDVSDGRALDRPAAWTSERLTISVSGVAHAVTGALVTGAFFDVLGVRSCEGRLLTPADAQTYGDGLVAVVSERFRRDRLGQMSSAVGQRLIVNGQSATVVGVACGGFRGALLTPGEDIWVPLVPYYQAIDSEASLLDRAQPLVLTVAALPDGQSRDATQLRLGTLASVLAERYPDSHAGQRLVVVPYSATAVLPIARMSGPFLALLAALTLVTVVLVSANVANLMLVRSLARQREVALRQALGATRGRILRLLVIEGLTVSLLAGAVASGVAWALARALVRLIGPGPGGGLDALTPDWSLVAYAMALALTSTVAFTTAPALRTWRQPVLPWLKAGERPIAGSRSRAMNGLVVAQFAFSVLLLTSAGLAYRSLALVTSRDVGFTTDRLLSVTVRLGGRDAYEDRTTTPAERLRSLARMERAREQVLTGGRITGATYLRRLPGAYLNTQIPVASSGGHRVQAIRRAVGPDYLATLGIAPVLGRDIAASDQGERPRVAVVNQHLADTLWPGLSPIGQAIFVGTAERAEVVGVAPNVFFDGPSHDPRPRYVFVAEAQDTGPPPIDLTLLVRHTGPVREAADIAGTALGGGEDGLPIVALATMSERLEQVTENERAITRLLLVFAGIALLVATLGLYAVAAFHAGRRVREFGVRLALGATGGDIGRDVLASSVRLAAGGVLLGCAASGALATVVGRQFISVSPVDPPVYLAVAVSLAVIAIIAALGPALRACRVDVLGALRQE